ncbi:MAG: class IV adenylate cyclase [Anaerolineae bacterium]|jgi:adenylate cyclase class 2|nr:class IV adenylate cyclase [Anaerolineae bacterium]
MTKHTETEVKLYVTDLASVAKRLEALGAVLIAPRVFERNVRYENADHTLTPRHIVLRLRQDTRARLTYKEPPTEIIDLDIPARFEAEVEVSDFETMELILHKLGFFPHVVYEKYRTTYHLGDLEIVLDEMPYGNFIEIEGEADAIRVGIDQLALIDATRYRANYLRLFDYVRRNLNLTFEHLTFANFEGISVPQTAFEPPLGA